MNIEPAHECTCTEARGRYGDCNDDTARGIPPSAEPKYIVRMPGRDESDAIARLIAPTGCTLAELLHGPDGKPNIAAFLYGPHDNPAEAIGLLKARGYNVEARCRQRP